MPVYTYRCPECGQWGERTFPLGQFPREVECAYCGALARKIIGRVNVQLHTVPGFHAHDYQEQGPGSITRTTEISRKDSQP